MDKNQWLQMVIKLATESTILNRTPFTREYEVFYDSLKKAFHLIVWGFSFRDVEILRKIQDVWLERNDPSGQELKILYIDPYLDKTRAQNNIKNTLNKVPGFGDSTKFFEVEQIPWSINESIKILKDNILKKMVPIK